MSTKNKSTEQPPLIDKIFSATVIRVEENGDAIVEIPDELVTQLEWNVGDEFEYEQREGKIYIRNITKDNNGKK